MPYYGETPVIDGDYTVVSFLESGSFVTPDDVWAAAEVLIVAGGGAGGTWCGGGGGAGGVLALTDVALSGTMTVTVGDGAPAPTADGDGASGSDSSFANRTATGGGGGGAYVSSGASGDGHSGGSGGGAGWHPSGTPGSGTGGQGHDGGHSNADNDGGGGGGAGAAGGDTSYGTGGAGGDGVLWHGSYYGGGGGGFHNHTTTAPAGGAGGGGAGSWGASGTPSGTAGTANTGGGGGGGWYAGYSSLGGAGGSGIVIIRYLTEPVGYVATAAAQVTGSGTVLIPATVTTDGDYTVWTFDSPGTGNFITPTSGQSVVGTVLIVGGGGGGGRRDDDYTYLAGGGGGAGGLRSLTDVELSGTMAVVVGAGGDVGCDGGASSFAGTTAHGGGHGGQGSHIGNYGGSGGGGGGGVGGPAGGSGASGEGHAGSHGYAYSYGDHCGGGAGGGAGGEGGEANGGGSAVGGTGGTGTASSITGTSLTYAVGGDGGSESNTPTAGTDGRGNGGGGGSLSVPTAAHGGNGTVIIRFLTPVNFGYVTSAATQVSGSGTVWASYVGTGTLTVGAAQATGWGSEPFSGGGRLTVGAAIIHGWGSEPVEVTSAAMRAGKVRVSGQGTVTPYTGTQTCTGTVTAGAAQVHGIGHWTKPGGGLPDPDPPGVEIPPWPPEAPTASLSSTTHTLIGNVAVSIGGVNYTPYAENLQFDSNVSGGFGTCSMNLRPPTPVPAYGDAVIVTGAAGLLWQGSVVNTPDITYTGEFIHYEVMAEGPYTQYGRAEDFSWLGSDSVTDSGGSWQQIDCQNWAAAPLGGFEITADTATGLMFQSTDMEGTAHDFTEIAAAHSYGDYYGWTPPPPDTAAAEGKGRYSADCVKPKALWSAFVYLPTDSSQKVTGLTANAYYDLATPFIDALTVTDWEHEVAVVTDPPMDPPQGMRWCDFDATPKLNLWTEFHGLAASPGSMWAGLYAVDDLRKLPVYDPIAMVDDEHLLLRFNPHDLTTQGIYAKCDPVTKEPILHTSPDYATAEYVYDEYGDLTFEVAAGYDAVAVACSANFLVFYATYVVTQMPVPVGYDFFPPHPGEAEPDPPYWFGWWASNEIYTEGRQYVSLRDVKVLGNDQSGEVADLGAAISAASGTAVSGITAAAGTDVKIDPFATRLAAIQQLVGMSDKTLYWGWDPGFFCSEVRGTVSFDATYPGVTVNAAIRNEGTVETATVVYTDTAGDLGGGVEDRRVLAAWFPTSETFDVDGNGKVDKGENSALLDGSYLLHSSAAASTAAQSYIVERGTSGTGPEWQGTVTLRGIPNAAATRVGYAVNCGDVTGAIITSVSVDVDSDTVTLSLGGTGYQDRFPSRPGQPNSAAPSNAAAYQRTLPYQTLKR